MNYKPVIGLEVHVELKTKSKMFCGCSADYFGKPPNTHTCPVCLGLPGALPVPNKTAIDWCIMIGLALNCKINLFSKFDRKNYFYPDLPKGYQISQYDEPFCINGHITLSSGKKIGITRVHMEEDTGKLTHEGDSSLIDFNRSGVPLVEIVTEPDFDSAKDVKEYLQKLQQIVRYLNVSNADMEKGDMRLEPNISLRKLSLRGTNGMSDEAISMGSPRLRQVFDSEVAQTRGAQAHYDKNRELPPYKVEVKNINSFRFVEKAIEYEIKRQQEILESGKTPLQETRGWHEPKQKTVSQRSKEDAHDYRYFPEPDIPPIHFMESQISNIKSQMPELPPTTLARFEQQYKLSNYDSEILTREKTTVDYFEQAVILGKDKNVSPKQIANFIINKKINLVGSNPQDLVDAILKSTQTAAIDTQELEKIIKTVLEQNQKAVADFKKGKESVIMFLVGQVMREYKQKIDAQKVKELLLKALK